MKVVLCLAITQLLDGIKALLKYREVELLATRLGACDLGL